MQIKLSKAALGLALSAGLALGVTGARAASPPASPASWSYAESHVGYCQFGPGGCSAIVQTNSVTDQGRDYNALADANNASHGRALGWVTNDGLLPDLHGFALTQNGLPAHQGNFTSTLVEAAQAFTWNGAAIDLHADDLQATVHYIGNNGGQPANSVTAGFALLDSSVIDDPTLGAAWFGLKGSGQGQPTGAFSATCATPGAVGIADNGASHLNGEHASSFGATNCGDGVLHLETGDQFVIWEKLFLTEATPGAIDATHTFSLGFSDKVLPETQGFIASNLSIASFRPSIPEPGTWALMLVGFGGLGAALRRRRAAAPLTA
jgi:hypothetical protein